jgi:alkanesulfonate monooxygenase SsuD/methylene tetrahydromethanopterin reductase-like flavin-dependent oxidoreductase (luciferase family)
VGEVANKKIMTISPMLCLPDGDEARALYGTGASEVAPHFSVYFDTIPDFAAKLKDEPRPIPQTRLRELIARAAADPDLQGPIATGDASFEFHHQNGICVGSPDEVASTIARFRDVGFDQLVFIPTTSWDCPHEKVLESIRLLGKEVLPRFR